MIDAPMYDSRVAMKAASRCISLLKPWGIWSHSVKATSQSACDSGSPCPTIAWANMPTSLSSTGSSNPTGRAAG